MTKTPSSLQTFDMIHLQAACPINSLEANGMYCYIEELIDYMSEA